MQNPAPPVASRSNGIIHRRRRGEGGNPGIQRVALRTEHLQIPELSLAPLQQVLCRPDILRPLVDGSVEKDNRHHAGQGEEPAVPGQLECLLLFDNGARQQVQLVKSRMLRLKRSPGGCDRNGILGNGLADTLLEYAGIDFDRSDVFDRRTRKLGSQGFPQIHLVPVTGKENPIDAGQRNVVLLQKNTAVERVFDVRRGVPFADDGCEVEIVVPLHEDQAGEFIPDIGNDGDFFFLQLVAGSHQVHQRHIGTVDNPECRKPLVEEGLDLHQQIVQLQSIFTRHRQQPAG